MAGRRPESVGRKSGPVAGKGSAAAKTAMRILPNTRHRPFRLTRPRAQKKSRTRQDRTWLNAMPGNRMSPSRISLRANASAGAPDLIPVHRPIICHRLQPALQGIPVATRMSMPEADHLIRQVHRMPAQARSSPIMRVAKAHRGMRAKTTAASLMVARLTAVSLMAAEGGTGARRTGPVAAFRGAPSHRQKAL